RHDVVVIRIEPLRHFHRGHVAAFSLTAARHREVRVEVDLIPLPTVPRRHSAYERAGVEHTVIKGEIVCGNAIDADRALQFPVALPELRSGREELLRGELSGPVSLCGALQFARGTEGWEAQIRGDSHRKKGILGGSKPFRYLAR